MKPPPSEAKSLRDTARSYTQSLAGYGLIELGAVAALETAALGMLTPVMPLYLKHDVGASPEQIGLTFTVFFIALAISEYFWGMLSDRIGMRVPLIIGTLLAAITTAGFVISRNINFIYAMNFLRALGTSALFPTARGHIGSTVPLRNKAAFMGYYMTVQALGRTVGSFTGGLVGERSMALVFYLAGGSLLAANIVATLRFKGDVFKPKLKSMDSPQTPASEPMNGDRYLLNLSVLGVVIALFNLSFTIRNSFLPLHAEASAGLNVAESGYLFTAWSLVSLACTMPLGHFADRIGLPKAMTIGQIILAVTMAAFAYANSFVLFMFIMIVNSFSNCIFRPAASARFSELMPRSRQATAMGILGVFEDVGNIIGPLIAGYLWTLPGGPALSFLTGGACALVGMFLGLIRPQRKEVT